MHAKKFFLLLLLLPTVLMASTYTPCSESTYCSWLSDTTIYGEWLYWRVRRSNLDYAIPFVVTGENSAIGKVFKVTPDYKSGFRVGLRKKCECADFEVRYTYFQHDWTDSASSALGRLAGTRLDGINAAVNVNLVNFAKSKWEVDYDQVDLMAGYTCYAFSCLTSRLFGGFTWARIDQEFEVTYMDLTNKDTIRQVLDMDAYGLNVGVDGSYQLGCLHFFGAFWYNALLGDFAGRWIYDNTDNFIGNLRDNTWEMLSVFNLAFGLHYRHCFCHCFVKDLAFSIGYEFHHWNDMPDFLAITGDGTQMVVDRRINFDFDGLFVRFAFGF